jgi:hypothetical protein
MSVVFSPRAVDYLGELCNVLLDDEYLGTYDFARKYVDSLARRIYNELPFKLAKKTNEKLCKRFGRKLYYTTFKQNSRTEWYVFFQILEKKDGEKIYYVKHISNNHLIAKYLYI